jgi:DNA-directed RNA polymerase subunit RPC12/RpoP
MAIRFHCDHCGKEIKADDGAGGKWGKCPSCHSKLYVPNLNISDELRLAPIDETEEQKKKRLMAETYQLTQDILQEREVPEGATDLGGPASEMSEKEMTKNIILYLRQMADGELGDAESTAAAISPHGRQAVAILDRIALSDIPEPELADLAPQVLAGLIRTLRSKIG